MQNETTNMFPNLYIKWREFSFRFNPVKPDIWNHSQKNQFLKKKMAQITETYWVRFYSKAQTEQKYLSSCWYFYDQKARWN